MKQQKFVFSKSIAFRWIISYAIIMLIPLIISAVVYTQTKKVVEYEIQRASGAMLKQVKYMVDSEISQAEKLAMLLSIHNDVNSFLNMNPDSEQKESFQIFKIQQELSKYKSANHFIKGIYLYSGKLGTMLTDETYADSALFYEMNRQQFNISEQEWQQILDTPIMQSGKLRPFIQFKRVGNMVLLIKPLASIKEKNTTRGVLFIALNSSTVQKMLANVDWVNNGDVYIVDQANQIMFQNNKIESPPIFSMVEMDNEAADSSLLTIAGTENMVSFIASDTSEWKYVSVFPSDTFWEKAREIRNLNLLGLLVCFLIGGVVIYYVARRNYDPVRELVNVFSYSKQERSMWRADEFSFIRENALATIRERDDMSSREYKQLRVLQAYYLTRLLKGQAEEGLSAQEAAGRYHLNWSSEHFAVLLFDIRPDEASATSMNLSHFIVSNIMLDVAQEFHSLSFTDMDGMLAAVINIHPERISVWKEDMEQALVKTLEFTDQRYRLQIFMAGSEQELGVAGIHHAYLQALEAQEYRLFSEENVSIWYGDIEPLEADYYLSINDELAFINIIKTGDLEKATEKIEGILNQVFSSQSSIEMLKCAMIDLASSMMKSVPLEAQHAQIWEESRPMKRLLACTTRGEFRQELLQILQMVCDKINEKLALLSNTGIGEQVAEYVEKNFDDSNLSVSMIGAEFGITPQYVSRLFKEQMEVGLHDFISQTRTSKAKLLLQQGASIEETSAKSGFSSSSAFIRVFKKYEGITPGKYKNLQV